MVTNDARAPDLRRFRSARPREAGSAARSVPATSAALAVGGSAPPGPARSEGPMRVEDVKTGREEPARNREAPGRWEPWERREGTRLEASVEAYAAGLEALAGRLLERDEPSESEPTRSGK